MKNFKLLNHDECKKVWSKFHDLYDFKPSINGFPAVRTNLIHSKFDVTKGFSNDFPMNKLEEFALDLFCKLTAPNDRLYALNWQHECYDFDPRKSIERDDFNEWIVPIFPNGDYYIFLTK